MLICLLVCGTGTIEPAWGSWYEQAKLTASDPGEQEAFGYSVSINGDYAVVGKFRDDPYTSSGAAYVFRRDGTTWTQEAKLSSPVPEPWDGFGHSVSISGSYAIVGARIDSEPVFYSGAAYVFARDGSNWVQQARLKAADPGLEAFFGQSVAIDGDHVIAGAPFDDPGTLSSGSAYIFQRNGTTWSEVSKLVPSDAARLEWFGNSVSISGDYAVVGAPRDDHAGVESGSAYVFVQDGTSWAQQTKPTASDAAADDWFGKSVSISGDWSIVSSRGGVSSGSAYIFHREGTEWIESEKLIPSDAATGGIFRSSVSMSGDWAIVGGGIWNDGGGQSFGSAYIFHREGTNWVETAKLTASDLAAGDLFGYSVSISGLSAAVGAHGHGDGLEDSGAGYVYLIPEPVTLLLLAVGGLCALNRRLNRDFGR